MEYKEGTIKIFQRLFKVSQVIEDELDKDLGDFSRDDLRRLGFMYMPKTAASSAANITYIQKYIDWCIDKKFRRGLNPLISVDTEWKRQFANASTKRFWTDRELDKIIESRNNAQDAVIISLLRNGVRGIGNSELLNLNKRSIDEFNNKLHLVDDNDNKRTIEVSEQCIKLCKQAIQETEYEKMNGNPDPNTRSMVAQLVDNDFVLRNANTRTVHVNEADKNIVHRRLTKIGDELGEINFIPLSITRSGMLEMAKNRFVANGKLTDEDLIEVAIQFDEKSDGAIYRMKTEFLNEATIKELYKLT
jgi:site-specific recombinase XerD